MDKTTLENLKAMEKVARPAPWMPGFGSPDFVCAMRNALPELLAYIAELEAAADELLLLKDDLKHSNPEEYERRKEPAWAALRKARGVPPPGAKEG